MFWSWRFWPVLQSSEPEQACVVEFAIHANVVMLAMRSFSFLRRIGRWIAKGVITYHWYLQDSHPSGRKHPHDFTHCMLRGQQPGAALLQRAQSALDPDARFLRFD